MLTKVEREGGRDQQEQSEDYLQDTQRAYGRALPPGAHMYLGEPELQRHTSGMEDLPKTLMRSVLLENDVKTMTASSFWNLVSRRG